MTLRNSLRAKNSLAQLRYFQRVVLSKPNFVEISNAPHLSDAARKQMESSLSKGSCLIEYGAGSSTLWFAGLGLSTVSVESSFDWASSVRRGLEKFEKDDQFNEVAFQNVGAVGEWGTPILRRPAFLMRFMAKNYAQKPWNYIRQKNANPTHVLIDGRFRIACLAYTALVCKERNLDPIIWLDDYFEREDAYASALKICHLTGEYSPTAELKLKQDLSEDTLKLFLDQSLAKLI